MGIRTCLVMILDPFDWNKINKEVQGVPEKSLIFPRSRPYLRRTELRLDPIMCPIYTSNVQICELCTWYLPYQLNMLPNHMHASLHAQI